MPDSPLVHVHALAIHPAVPGDQGPGRGLRLLEVQLRHADHKPAAKERGELLDGVMNNYRRSISEALFHYPWRGTGFRRRYLLGCLYGSSSRRLRRTFYDLGKAGYWGPQTKKTVDFHFDETRTPLPKPSSTTGSPPPIGSKAAERRDAVRAQMKSAQRTAPAAAGRPQPCLGAGHVRCGPCSRA